MLGFLVGEALRDLRRAGRVAVSAIVLITLSLAALGGFWLVSSNLDRAVAQWRDRVRIVVYLRREPPAADVAALLERVRVIPGVAGAVFIGKADALRALRQLLGKDAGVVDQLPANPLPASLEVTPAAAAATPEGARDLLARLNALPEADEVAGSADWVEQLSHWQRLLTTIGLGVGAVLAIAAILTVTTATTLVLHARRHETEIMRLVGASEVTIRLPLLLQGMMQGLAGAVLALVALVVAHSLVAPRLEPLVNLTLGLSQLVFFTPVGVVALLAAGTLLGGLGGARRARAMRRAALVAILAISVAIPAAAQPKREDPLQAEQRKLQQTQKQLKEEKERAAAARARETSLLAELEDIDRRLAAKQRDVARLEAQIKRAQADVQLFRGEISKLERHRAGQMQALAGRLRVMYRVHAQGGALPVILSGDDPVTRAVAVRHLASLAALDARLIQEYRVTSERLADRKGREEAQQRELASLHEEAKQEQAEVDREAAKRRTLLAKVRDERAYHERMVGELTEASHRLEAFIRELQAKQRKLAKVPPPKGGIEPPAVGFGTLKGRLPWPTEGRIVTGFGAQVHPRFGTRTFRNGVDIEAAVGRDVSAVHAGHVI